MNLSTLSRSTVGTSRSDPTTRPADVPDHGAGPTRLARWCRGRPEDHPAVRPALVLLLTLTAALYLVGLGASGWANTFYSAAAQAGSESWKAMFFAASDSAGSITVDKTPMSIWVMAASVRLFGLSSWSILVPQALMGVATVGLLHSTVRRSTGNAWAGLVAGLVLALTPVATLMFRFNNPDALLVLLLVGATAATLRALETPDRAVRWLALGGALVGLGFLTKMLQAFLVLPALAGVYLLAAVSVPLVRRLGHLVAAFAAMLLAGGWWVVVVELWPASSRPWIGGSQDNSVLELTLGYNGIGRLNGDEVGSVGGGGRAGGPGWGETGVLRLFSTEVGGQVAWLLPAALLLLVLGLWFVVRSGRGWRERPVTAALVAWGLWLLVTATTFSLMAGIFHAYYNVALAPAIGAVLGIGGHLLWQHRRGAVATVGAVVVLVSSAATAVVLLDRSAPFLPWLAPVVIALTVATCVGLLVIRFVPARRRHRAGVALVVGGLVVMLAGPAAYAVDTAATPHAGSIPSAGPEVNVAVQGGGPGRGRGGPRNGTPPQGMTGPAPAGTPPQGAGQAGTGTGAPSRGVTGQASPGGLLEGSTSSAAVDALLEQDASSYTWAAAAVGSNSAAGFQLSTRLPVMAIGGFNGSDPSPTLERFQQLVADGEIHWFVASGSPGGRGGPGGGSGTSSEIAAWVEESFTAITVDGTTLYDLSGGVR